jgi:uncharacterized protein YecE (DUF72 family)
MRSFGLSARPKTLRSTSRPFRLLTGHQTTPSALPKNIREAIGSAERKNVYYKDLATELADELWDRFRSALMPLQSGGKLAAVLFQFPPWFIPNRDGYAHVLVCAEKLEGIQVAIEFGNKIWFEGDRRERVLSFLRDHKLVHVVVDEPPGFGSSVPTLWEVTSPSLAIVRFHRRNKEMWEKKGLASAAQRFNYLYSEAELRELAAHVIELAENAQETHALFNNCYRDYGQRNAIDFQRLV